MSDDQQTTKTYVALAETFDVEDVVDNSRRNEVVESTVVVPQESSVDADADAVRGTLFKLLQQGEEAFEDLKRIAIAEESPRSFEVLNSMLGNLSDIAVRLMDVHEKKAKIKRESKASEPTAQPVNNGVVNNNTVFIGTTTELQNIISNMNLK